MTKINKEEYKFLKSLDDKWKWIARDDNYGGSIFCFRKKPNKDIRRGEWGPDTTQYKWLGKCEILFQFIKWEDREPYNIAELIEEYEHKEFYDYVGWKYAESEETEMKKDIEWLKREIYKELEAWHGVEGGIDEDGINEIMLLINQFEESKVKQLYEKISELESYNDELIRDNNQLRNEIDNQEVLSSDWIDEHKKRKFFDFDEYRTEVILVEDLQNLLVPKQELPVIPKFVADWIESRENNYPSDVIGVYLRMNELSANKQTREVLRWVHESKLNRGSFARAWLDGYTVGEEQKYYLKIGNLYLAEPLGDMTSDIVRMTRDKGVAYQFTDEKSIATHLDKFEGTEAVKVEELEE